MRKSFLKSIFVAILLAAGLAAASDLLDPEQFDQAIEAHWAFQPPVAADPPAAGEGWARNPIDRFVAAKHAEAGVTPSEVADKRTLIRRVSLDLIGLPPTPEEIDAFVNDDRPDAYERLVDRLLASPHYGERYAQVWLDLARYADTNGYEKDRPRTVWPYRDWVINALNADMPYDQFVVEQIAGDLLPNATQDQHIATGFLRNSMLNEEGGVDVEEFRYEAMVDRVNTIGASVLGLTIGCAQCHDHKYDPMWHEEYFEFMAFINNTDDVTTAVVQDSITKRREEIQHQIKELEAGLSEAFPAGVDTVTVLTPTTAQAESDATLEIDQEGWIRASGDAPEKDRYTVELSASAGQLDSIQLETAVAGPGPGRAYNGNFVLSEIAITHAGEPVPIASAEANREQPNFAPAKAIDGDANNGWAVDDGRPLNESPPILKLTFAKPITLAAEGSLTIRLDHRWGNKHTLGQFRFVNVKSFMPDPNIPIADQREERLMDQTREWAADAAKNAHEWNVLQPLVMQSSNRATMRRLGDDSILVSGDNPNQDTYTVTFRVNDPTITAIRLEALTHDSLPDGGPGRAPLFSVGDFLLSEIKVETAPGDDADEMSPVAIARGTADHEPDGRTAQLSLDGRSDTGWSVKGAIGEPHRAVFLFEQPIEVDGSGFIRVTLAQIFIHNHTIGRFRISVTSDEGEINAATVPANIEAILARPEAERDYAALSDFYLTIAPELADVRSRIADLRRTLPAYPESLTLEERTDVRPTYFYHRGEYLQRKQTLEAATPKLLHAYPGDAPRDRLGFARWLMAEENPLAARVAVNRAWQMYFGRGLVDTPEDFGLRGSVPSHPELLDWLAIEFMNSGWSLKQLARMIVTSAAYRQTSSAAPESYKSDPNNRLLARGPRFRVPAETVRDIALASSGLLNEEMGGPSEYLPLPDGLLETVYPGGAWPTAQGKDRYRRSIYTYWKRVLPYPSMMTFDASARDVTCTRRERSNTPLQALTLLNDDITMDAARALAYHTANDDIGFEETLNTIYNRCIGRAPTEDETASIHAFFESQKARIESGDADAKTIAGKDATADYAAWVLVCRAILNLDETITKT